MLVVLPNMQETPMIRLLKPWAVLTKNMCDRDLAPLKRKKQLRKQRVLLPKELRVKPKTQLARINLTQAVPNSMLRIRIIKGMTMLWAQANRGISLSLKIHLRVRSWILVVKQTGLYFQLAIETRVLHGSIIFITLKNIRSEHMNNFL